MRVVECRREVILVIDWDKIKAEYIRGNTSYRRLAEKYGISGSAVKAHMAREKWTQAREERRRKATGKIIAAAAERDKERADRIYDAADVLIRKIAAQIEAAERLCATDASAYATALEKCKRVCEIRGAADGEELEGRVVVIPARVPVEDEDNE